MPQDDQRPLGIMMKLQNLHDLFSRDNGMAVEIENTDPSYDIYPQAGLRKYGHFQANNVMVMYDSLLKRINDLIGKTIRIRANNDDDDEDDDAEIEQQIATAIRPIAMQGYNSFIHFARPSGAIHHEVQLGVVTGGMSGSYAQTLREKRIAFAKQQLCENGLPHDRFEEKIQSDEVPRDFRLESVYTIDMDNIKPSRRTGRYAN
jgi:hypothetical protein